MERDPASPVMTESYPAVAESVGRARRALSAFAVGSGATRKQADAVCLAASEALTNVVVHAYSGQRGEIHLHAAVASGELWVLIADDGAGLRPRGNRPGLGLGLAMIAEEAEEFSVVKRSSGGTEIRMRFRLGSSSELSGGQPRGSVACAIRPASSRFSTMT